MVLKIEVLVNLPSCYCFRLHWYRSDFGQPFSSLRASNRTNKSRQEDTEVSELDTDSVWHGEWWCVGQLGKVDPVDVCQKLYFTWKCILLSFVRVRNASCHSRRFTDLILWLQHVRESGRKAQKRVFAVISAEIEMSNIINNTTCVLILHPFRFQPQNRF